MRSNPNKRWANKQVVKILCTDTIILVMTTKTVLMNSNI